MSERGGRQDDRVDEPNVHDAPNRTVEVMLSNQDRLIDALKGMAAKLDADGGVTDTDYAADLTDAIGKLDLIL